MKKNFLIKLSVSQSDILGNEINRKIADIEHKLETGNYPHVTNDKYVLNRFELMLEEELKFWKKMSRALDFAIKQNDYMEK